MFDNIVFTADGLRLFERVLRSCPPEITNGGEKGKQYFSELAGQGEGITYSKLIRGLNLLSFELSVFGHLHQVACHQRQFVLNERFITFYFGGQPHIGKVLEGMGYKDFSEIADTLYFQKSLVSHILLPCEVIGISDGADVIYRNRDVQVHFSNLIPLADVNLEIGGKVLCHHSSIIQAEVSPELGKFLLDLQIENRELMEACRLIEKEGIDHKKMASFPWAKRAKGICCL